MKIKKITSSIIGIVCLVTAMGLLCYWYYNYKSMITDLNGEFSEQSNIVQDTDSLNTNNVLVSNDSDTDTAEMTMSEIYYHANELGEKAKTLEVNFIEQMKIYTYDSEHWEEAWDEIQTIQNDFKTLFLDSSVWENRWYSYDFEKIVPKLVFYLDKDYTDNQILGSWVFYDDDENVLATLMAQYDIDSDIFWNVRTYTTGLGNQYVEYEYDDDYTDENDISSQQFVSGVKSIADALNEYTKPLVVDPGDIPYKYTDEDEEETSR